MSRCEWIICERSGRWASAMTMVIGSQGSRSTGKHHIYQVRTLNELSARLAERPQAMALVEIRRADLAEALAWLVEMGTTFPQARSFALAERDDFDALFRDDLAAALLAAGAVGVIDSPRQMCSILPIGLRHFTSQVHKLAKHCEGESFSQWAWELLPWQST